MLRPIGSHSPAVYWRRRFVVLGGVVVLAVLLVLTVRALTAGGGSPAAAAGSSHTSRPPATHTTTRTSPPPHTTSSSHAPATPHSSVSTSGHAQPPQPCTAAHLTVAALSDHATYHVGDEPVLMLQATDTGATPCVQDFGNGKVALRVYNGESRVWGSNDCGPRAGSLARTLTPHQAVRVRITWSGLSSQPSCAGTRERVGAGTYTLYASLGAKSGAAAQFSIS